METDGDLDTTVNFFTSQYNTFDDHHDTKKAWKTLEYLKVKTRTIKTSGKTKEPLDKLYRRRKGITAWIQELEVARNALQSLNDEDKGFVHFAVTRL